MNEKEKRSPHIQMAHKYWQGHLQPGDCVIDATCGNGHDTLFLSQIVLSAEEGKVIGFDIQEKAIMNTKERLKNHLQDSQLNQVFLFHKPHQELKSIALEKPPQLIVYNLGYLPGGDKTKTTQTHETLQSIEQSLAIIAKNGALSITCYPGHSEGEKEEKAILQYVASLPSTEWVVSYHAWVNRPKSPSLLWIVRI